MSVEFLQEILDKFIKNLDISKEATKLKDSLAESQDSNKDLAELLEKTKNLVETFYSNSKDLKEEFFKQYNIHSSRLGLEELNDGHDSVEKEKEDSKEPQEASEEPEAPNELEASLKEPQSTKEPDTPEESETTKELESSKKVKAPKERKTSKKSKASKESEVPDKLETPKKCVAPSKPDVDKESEQSPQDENCNLGTPKKPAGRKDSSKVESSMDPLLENSHIENNVGNHDKNETPEVNGDSAVTPAAENDDIKSPDGKKPFKFGIKLVDINKLVEPKTAMRSPDASKYQVKKTVQFDSSVILISTSSDDTDDDEKNKSNKRRKSLEKEKHPKKIALVDVSSDDSSEDSQDEDFVVSKKTSKRDSLDKKSSPKKTLPSRRSKENAIKINKKLQKLDKISSKKHKKKDTSSDEDSSSLSDLSDSEEEVAKETESRASVKKNGLSKPRSKKEFQTVMVDGYDWHSDVKFKSKCVINVLRVPCEEMKEYYGNKQDDLEVSRLTDKKTLKRRRQKSTELYKSDPEKDGSSASSSPANSTDAVDKSKAKKTKLSDRTSLAAAAEDRELCPVTGSFKSKADSTSDQVDKTDTADEKNAKNAKKTKSKDGKKADKKDEDGKKSVESSSSDKDEDDLGSDGLPDFCNTSSPVSSPVQRPAPLEESQNGGADDATTEMADVAMEALNSDKEEVSNSDSDKDEEDVTEKETTKKKKNSKKKSKKEESDGKPSAENDDKSEENEEESQKDETTPEKDKIPTPSSSKDADKDKEDKDKGDKDKDEEKEKSDKESDVEEEGETPKKKKKKVGEAKKTKKSKFELSDTEEDEDKDGEDKDKDKEDGKSDGEDEDNKKEKGDEEDQSEEDDKKDKNKRKTVPSWKKDKLLTTKISSSDSEEESRKFKKKKKALKEASDKSDSEEEVSKRKTRQRNKGKKKTIVIDSDSDNDKKSNASSDDMFKSDDAEEDSSKSSNEESEKENENKKPSSRKRIKRVKDSSSDDNEEKSTRKQIRGIWGRDSLAETTKKAEAEERERKARIAEKQKKYNQIYDVGTDLNAKVDKIILDFDEKTKKGLIKVHKKIVEKMKPHQAAGVQFMWDACFESLERAQKTPGSGCILAHCMGLGKTLQVIALTHTLLVNYEKTKVKKVMVVCPLNTVLNWVSEYKQWLPDDEAFEVFELVSYKQNYERQHQIKEWHNCGGVLIIGYDMYRNLSNPDSKKFSKKMRQTFQEALVDPGPDLVVCDEGHLLKNEKTNLSIAMNRLKTLRRIVLTGTPLQNNMKEYFCMVQFIKPNLLGTYKEYLNRFVNPITNGQYTDSTPHDIQIMRKRSHVLHKMLDGVVQRRDYSVLQPYLPPKHEYVLFLNLTEVQIKLYEHYMMNFARRAADGSNKTSFLFVDFQNFQRICTHPRVLLDKSIEDRNAKDLLDDEESESEGSIKDFIDDDDDDDTTSEDSNSSSSDNSDDSDNSGKDGKKKKKGKSKKKDDKKGGASGSKSNSRGGPRKRLTRAAVASAKENNEDVEFMDLTDDSLRPKEWWQSHCDGEELDNIMHSSKLFLLFEILKECEQIGDKVLVFSQSLYSLNVIEYFLGKIHDATQEDKDMCGYTGSWCLGLDYFRLDGSSSCDNRSIWCKSFNNPKNTRARLFLISTRAGGLGINLVAANRVIIFDVSWNPSHDIQSIYRVYRFGQTKPSYVYRFVTYGTMEMKIYERQVTKQAISKRVIDEQQIDRHYNQNDLAELYKFEPRPEDRPIPLVPKDVLLGELLQKHEDRIFKYHEHQSLLENKAEECLNEEERKAAWEEFEHEKTVRAKTAQPNNFMAPPAITAALMSLVKRDNPAWTDNQVRAIIPALTVQLQEQVAAGDLTMYQRVTKEIRYLQQLQNQRMREQYLQQQALRMFQQQQAMVNGGMVFNPAMFQNLNMPGTSNQTMPRALNNPTVPNEVIDLND